MKKISTRFLAMFFLALVFLFTNQVSFASGSNTTTQFASQVVKSTVEASFTNYKQSLDNSKDKFGVSANESFSKARLGDGVPYFTVSNNSAADENGFQFTGYIFPIQVNGKPAGIVFTAEENGKWVISRIGSSLTFEQDIQGAKKLLKDTDQSKLVYDNMLGLYTLLVEHQTGEKSILPMKDNPAFNLKKNSLTPIAEIQTKIQALKYTKVSTGQGQLIQMGGIGTVPTDGPPQKSPLELILSGVAVIVLSTVAFFMVRKRKSLA